MKFREDGCCKWHPSASYHYKKKHVSRIKREEHCNRVLRLVTLEEIPKNWDDFNNLSKFGQERMAKIISIFVGLFNLERSAFITGVLMEYEWILANFWYFTCSDCGLPLDICNGNDPL